MFGLFNSVNPWRNNIQKVNLFLLAVSIGDFLTNPESTLAESGLQIAVQTLNVLCLSENSNAITDIFAAGMNFFGAGALYNGLTSGLTDIPALLIGGDLIGQALSAGSLTLSRDEEYRRASQAQPK